MRRGQSNESEPRSQKISVPKMHDNSDFTLSSLGNNENNVENGSNSIISEEDSAFEDQTPAAKRTNYNKDKSQFSNMKVNSAKKSQGNKSPNQQDRGNNLNNDKEVVDNMKKYVKQKTLGWK